MKTREKNVFLMLILTIFTLGIYYIYWIFDTSEHMKDESRLPATEVFFGIITLGIYFVYWHYKTAKKVYHFAQSKGYKGISDQSMICLLCSLIPSGGWIISMGLIQTNINTLHFLESRKNQQK
ncbi:DUF4234 domain-containing protein [Bacillus sp. HSf4]|uniref:DUF4234 domain-containing protein n=1 Tax=Bacillus sp. HSf4 TaxID=3035514 RepID=UPI00240A233D|nr:DUF4234 domain-containing protein [Bacillus sp. HSf4]WFA04295.1 DUF4234 domain-containing protein [Bacillus sp. HSf4]